MSTNTTRSARRAALEAAGALEPTSTDVITYHAELEYKPDVPKKVRDIAYFATLGTAAVSALASGITGIWFPEIAAQVLATGGVATTVMGIIGGGLGVIYRPGAQRA